MRLLYAVLICLIAALFAPSPAHAQQSWTSLDELPAGIVAALLVDSDTLYAVIDSVLCYRPGAGAPWQISDPITSEVSTASLAKVGPRIFVGTYTKGVYETTNLGATWTPRSTGLSGLGALSVTALTVRGDSLYAGTAGSAVFVLNLNGGTSWTPFRTGIPSNVAWEVITLYQTGSYLFCGSGQNSYIHVNAPGQTTWTGYDFNELIQTDLGMLAFGGTTSDLIGVAFNGVYTSTDTGKTWAWFPTPFIAAADGAVVITPHRTFAAFGHASRGMYIYERAAQTWQLFDHQPIVCTDLVWFEDRLYAGSFDGLRYLPISPTDIQEPPVALPSAVQLSRNYPNPFNPSTTIRFSLAQASPVQLTVFNILGQEIRTLVDEYKPAGDYSVIWDGRDVDGSLVSSGVYLYRLTTDQGSLARQMVLVK
ncbi:T9SS type A sorting domain-containing protein [bacterium]|nr:T9SS type A sorting domain-containing protein [bacterium]